MTVPSSEASAGLEFLEAAYALERTDEEWLAATVRAARDLWPHGCWGFGFFYDASDSRGLRAWNPCHVDSPAQIQESMLAVVVNYPPEIIAEDLSGHVGRKLWAGPARGSGGNQGPRSLRSGRQAHPQRPRPQRAWLRGGRGESHRGRPQLAAAGPPGRPSGLRLPVPPPPVGRQAVCVRGCRSDPVARWTSAGRAGASDVRTGATDGSGSHPEHRRPAQQTRTAGAHRTVVATGGSTMDPGRGAQRKRRALHTGPRKPDVRDRIGSLTPREQQVVTSAALGRSNKEIAYELGVSHSTIRAAPAPRRQGAPRRNARSLSFLRPARLSPLHELRGCRRPPSAIDAALAEIRWP